MPFGLSLLCTQFPLPAYRTTAADPDLSLRRWGINSGNQTVSYQKWTPPDLVPLPAEYFRHNPGRIWLWAIAILLYFEPD